VYHTIEDQRDSWIVTDQDGLIVSRLHVIAGRGIATVRYRWLVNS
jgi:hypothetical protein